MFPGSFMIHNLFNNIRRKCCKNVFCIAFFMDVKIDRFGEIQTEDTHDGFGVDDITAGDEVKISIKLCKCVNERFYFIDGI